VSTRAAESRIPILTCSVALSRDGCLDTGSQVNITPLKEHVLEYEEGSVDVTGVHGGSRRARKIKMGFNTVTSDGTPLQLCIPGPSILDPHDGGTLRTPQLVPSGALTL